jgi:superfamily II DNA helicase RecQ
VLVGTLADFRGNQLETIHAIVSRQPIVLQIAGTGVGKSLAFMLPAITEPEDISVVVVPLVLLQSDLLQHCQVSKIRAKIKGNDEEYHCDFSILLVTPESVATSSFVDYINYLIAQQKLDRFYVDECHCLLSATLDFRRRMTEI